MMSLQLSVRRLGGYAIVEAEGEADAESAPTLERYLRKVLEERSHRLIVDLEKLVSIDPRGLTALAAAERRAIQLGGLICLARPRAAVMKVLHLGGLDQYFLIYPTPEAAATPP